ncbi:hypothetical protein NB689_003457 [Xanthomonas sacchari]|nr:hypothetical protein [Xanthomonas sacchari]
MPVVRLDHRRVDVQAAPPQQPLQHALVQGPGLDSAPRHAAAQPRQQAALHGQPALALAQPEAVVLHDGQPHRQGAHQQQQRRQHHGEGHRARHPAQLQVRGVAEQLPPVVLDRVGDHALGEQVVGGAERGEQHHHAAVGDQALAQHLGGGQRQQQFAVRRGSGCSVGIGRGDRVGGRRAVADLLFQRQRLVQPQHPHLRLGLGAAGRLQPHLGHAEQPVQQRLVHHHVVDARERDLAQAAFQPAAADAQAVVADAVLVGEIAQQRHRHQPAAHRQHHQVIGVIAVAVAAAEHQQRQQRQQEMPEVLQQHEQPRPRMQAPHRRGVFGVGQAAHSASSSWSSWCARRSRRRSASA